MAQIYPKDAMTVTAQLPEADLGGIAVGQKVRVELDWNQDSGAVYEGTVEMISAIGTETALEDTTVTYYTVYISFTPDADTRYGMTATYAPQVVEYVFYADKNGFLELQFSLGNAVAPCTFTVSSVRVQKAADTSRVSDTIYRF